MTLKCKTVFLNKLFMKSAVLTFTMASMLFFGQTVSQKMDTEVQNFLRKPAAESSSLSVYVTDDSGNIVYQYDENRGLSTASTQKIFTAAAALDALGPDYRYTTTVAVSGKVINGELNGNLYITAGGDPTLGSWRYEGYKPEDFLKKIAAALKAENIRSVNGNLVVDDSCFDFQTVPGGWPWNDMGNYYGAGVWGLNWRENQFDLTLKNGEIQSVNVDLPDLQWVNEVKTGGNEDHSLIFTAPHSTVGLVNGTLPAKSMTVSGAMPDPPAAFGSELMKYLSKSQIGFKGKVITASQLQVNKIPFKTEPKRIILTHQSPTLETIVYWFLRKSVNLYGETFIKTLGLEKKGTGSFSAGMDFLKEFWKSKGINAVSINFADGSGLSPQNYVSAKAEVKALQWAKKQHWFSVYYEGFPVQQNGIKMKSGSMKDVKSFAGYHNGYTFSAILNNYAGNGSEVLFKILNPLK